MNACSVTPARVFENNPAYSFSNFNTRLGRFCLFMKKYTYDPAAQKPGSTAVINNFRTLFVATASCLLLTACSSGSSGDISKSSQVLARVGDKEITTTYFERQLANLPHRPSRLLHRQSRQWRPELQAGHPGRKPALPTRRRRKLRKGLKGCASYSWISLIWAALNGSQ